MVALRSRDFVPGALGHRSIVPAALGHWSKAAEAEAMVDIKDASGREPGLLACGVKNDHVVVKEEATTKEAAAKSAAAEVSAAVEAVAEEAPVADGWVETEV